MCPLVPPDDSATGHSPEPDSPPARFSQLVRSALSHIYDYSYLQNHPLAPMVGTDLDHDRVTRAQELRRALLDCIEELRPAQHDENLAERARSYALLTSRYLDGLGVEEIADELGISRRHAFRELEKGVKAVSSLLWDRTGRARGTGAAEITVTGTEHSDRVDTAAQGFAMAWAEVERLRQNLHPEYLDLENLIEGILGVAKPLAQKRGLQITLECDSQNLVVYADRIMTRQALLNLISQALDTNNREGTTVRISRDQGSTILDILSVPESAFPHYTELPGDEGTRIAVSVAQRLIHAQGGHLLIHHDSGGWAARVLLPVVSGPTVLVIDDNADLVALFQRYLVGHDVSLIGTADSTRAIELAEELQPHLIILDLMMPSQDGWEILRQLCASSKTRGIPVIICSVLDGREMAMASGASDYLPKPVNQVELLAVLRRWLGALRPTA